MKIFFDSQILKLQKTGGIGSLFLGLVKSFSGSRQYGVTAVLGNRWLQYLTEEEVSNVLVFGDSRKCPDIDLHHLTYYLPSPLPKAPKIVTLHDLTHEKGLGRNAAFWSFMKRASLRSASGLIYSSLATQSTFLARSEADVTTPSRVITPFSKYSDYPHLNSEREDFFLYVGRRRGYKSFVTLLDALRLDKLTRVVMVGGERPNREEKELIHSGQLVWVEHADDDLLFELFRKCKALVSTSLDEGFGMNLAEAASVGCPVIATNIKPHREANPLAIFYTPGNANDLARLLTVEPAEFYGSSLRQKRAHISGFAQKHAEFYKEVLDSR